MPPLPGQTPDPWEDDFGGDGPGDTEEATPYKGTSLEALARMFKEGQIGEADFKAELDARVKAGSIGQKTADLLIEQNRPASRIQPPSFEGGAGGKDFSNLSETDILDGIKNGRWSHQEAFNMLVGSKGYSAAAANETLRAYSTKQAETGVSPAIKALQQQLAGRGLGPKLSEAEILEGAMKKLWSPDDAYDALRAFKGYTDAEAASTLKLKGWQGGPKQQQAAQAGVQMDGGFKLPAPASHGVHNQPYGVKIPTPNPMVLNPNYVPQTEYEARLRQTYPVLAQIDKQRGIRKVT